MKQSHVTGYRQSTMFFVSDIDIFLKVFLIGQESLAKWIGCSPCTQEVEGSTPTGGTCPNDFSDPIDQDIRTQWALSRKIVAWEWRSVRVAVGDCSATERRRWRPPYQTGKTVHVHAKHYKHNEDGRMARVCGSVPLSRSGNVVTRIEIHTFFIGIIILASI